MGKERYGAGEVLSIFERMSLFRKVYIIYIMRQMKIKTNILIFLRKSYAKDDLRPQNKKSDFWVGYTAFNVSSENF